MRRQLFLLALLLLLVSVACGGSPKVPTAGGPPSTQAVFETVVPSIVAILNDDRAILEEEAKNAMKEIGIEPKAPKQTIDVSLRKEPQPHGTGFLIEGGMIITAAHVVLSPEVIKVTTRAGQTVDAELVHIDEVRDVAILKPKTELKGVAPLKLANEDPKPGRKVWALGHTGNGLWALSWGISEGIASGIVELLGAKLLLFDAPVYPGFSGGPVITLDDAGTPRVVGVNHAILFTGRASSVASISSASSVPDIRDAIARKSVAIEPTLADYAKKKLETGRAELFITRNLSVHKNPQMLTTASILGNEKSIEAGTDDIARVPVVAMIFGIPTGKHDIVFELEDPSDNVIETITKSVKVGDRERVAFATADFRFDAKVAGRYDVIAKVNGKVLGRTDVWIEDPDDDEQPVDDEDLDDVDEGGPRAEVVVASMARDEPFAAAGIRATWMEWRYPRRVGFTWFARGSRGWSGTNVAITAYVIDEKGKIAGSALGCFKPELRPEHTWSCAGSGGSPLLTKEGRYDVVFTMNNRPFAVWPMEAMVRTSTGGASAMDKWMSELKKQHALKKHARPKPAPPPPPAAKPDPKSPATKPDPKPPAKPPAKPTETKPPGLDGRR